MIDNFAKTEHQVRPIAAVVSNVSGDCDAVVAGFVDNLRGAGWQVRGLLQAMESGEHACRVFLVDVASKVRYLISQDLGAGSNACCLDSGLMVEAGHVLREIPALGADLAIVNRFGGLEVVGEGFADELLCLMGEGVPVLVIVPQRHLPVWRDFTGGLADELPPDPSLLLAWFSRLQAESVVGVGEMA